MGDFVKDLWFMAKQMELGSDSSWMLENKVAETPVKKIRR